MLLQAEVMLVLGLVAALASIGLGLALSLVATRYKRCPSNKLLVVFGLGVPGGIHVQHGGARLVWPLIQSYGWLFLQPVQVPLAAGAMMNREGVNVSIEGDLLLAIGTSPEKMECASKRLLGLDPDTVSRLGADEAHAALRELVSMLSTDMIVRDRDRLAAEFNEILGQRLEAFGLEVISVRLGKISDSAGLAAAMEQEAVARVTARAQFEQAELLRRQEEDALWRARLKAARQMEADDLPRPGQDVLREDPGDALKRM